MGETLAETRVEVDAQRGQVERNADELRARVRHALDLKARFRENPVLFIGIGAGALYLVTGGPIWTFRLLRRRLSPTPAEKTYDSLPKPMQKWVDTLIDDLGPKAQEARDALAEEVVKWRLGPMKNKKARKELARAMVEGPPGPQRTAWKAAEAGLTLVSAALARKAIEAFLTGEKPVSGSVWKKPPQSPKEAAKEYSGMSERASKSSG
jgi:hypothetical protein